MKTTSRILLTTLFAASASAVAQVPSSGNPSGNVSVAQMVSSQCPKFSAQITDRPELKSILSQRPVDIGAVCTCIQRSFLSDGRLQLALNVDDKVLVERMQGDADFEAFASALNGLGSRKVLVHCQINLRASSMVFLYRAIVLKEEPRVAYQAVSGVWSPDGPWRRLIEDELRKHKVAFEPFDPPGYGLRWRCTGWRPFRYASRPTRTCAAHWKPLSRRACAVRLS